MRSTKNKTLRYLGIALIAIGIVIIAYPFYTNFVMKRREEDVMNSWENQISLNTDTQASTQATTDGTLAGNDTQATDESGNTNQSQTTQSGDQSQSGETTFIGQANLSQQVIPGATFKITIPKIKACYYNNKFIEKNNNYNNDFLIQAKNVTKSNIKCHKIIKKLL